MFKQKYENLNYIPQFDRVIPRPACKETLLVKTDAVNPISVPIQCHDAFSSLDIPQFDSLIGRPACKKTIPVKTDAPNTTSVPI